MSNQPENIVVPSSPEDRKKILNALNEITNSMLRIDSERDHIKDIKDRLKDEFEIPPKTAAKIANAMHKQNYKDVQAEQENFELLYETLISSDD